MEEYFAEVGVALNNKKRREAFALYAIGLFSELPRKSVEPIAAAVEICPGVVDRPTA
jgi:SRSO17 transposase